MKPLTPPIAWSERLLQDAIYIWCAIKMHEIVVPNSQLFAWESDVVSVNRTGFIFEFEVKISRADFRADARKDRAALLIDPVKVHRVFGPSTFKRPNYFYYAVPEGLILPSELPEYAGLLYIRRPVRGPVSGNVTHLVREAKRLHTEKINDKQRCQLARAVSRRYWRQRLKSLETGREAE